ncbi:MAG: RNA ligase family protein [Nannocystaceae bacterium]
MKPYPSIPTKIRADVPILAFDKLDGSQLRAEWTSKAGFVHFGTRHRPLDPSHPHLGDGVALVRDKFEAEVTRALKARKIHQALLFFEFLGPRSFAGRHVDEVHDVILLDVAAFGRGLLPPDEFMAIFGHLDTAKLLYEGHVTREFVDSVRAGTFPGVTSEGVVCKSPAFEKRRPVMFKIKAQAWLDRLRDLCAGDDALFEELA